MTSELKSWTDGELLARCLRHDINFAMCRMPDADTVEFYAAERWLEVDDIENVDGFLAAPFDKKEKLLFLPAEYARRLPAGALAAKSERAEHAPLDIAPDSRYLQAVDELIATLKERGGKTVFSHQFTMTSENVDFASVFSNLLASYPSNFVCAWYMRDSRSLWMCATPELLLQADDNRLSTVALAGTRSADIEGEWDDKNKAEQTLVTMHILDVFSRHGLTPEVGKTFTRRTGHLAHICTPVSAVRELDTLSALIGDLAPTPAVCGSDRAFSLDFLHRHELHPRGFYAGYCGLITPGSLRLFVTLRCLSADMATQTLTIYAGGGITARSNTLSEWREVCAKADSIAAHL